MRKKLFVLCMLLFLAVFVVTDVFCQPLLKQNKTLNSPPKINENIPKEKLKPTVKSREFRDMDFIAGKILDLHRK